jgi:glycosyltransferase involved in cell wall biosynthesis
MSINGKARDNSLISVVIFTKNEEQDLPGCLQSVSWSDDVHVFDSFSTDQTVPIASRSGAKIQQRKFDNFASQKNAALRELHFRYVWVLLLDADERVPARLVDEMKQFIATAPPVVSAARLRRRDFFMGTWLKHAQISPFYIRLVRPEKASYEREVNEVMKVDGEIWDLNEPFDHFPFSKGIARWVDKHNSYSTMEARLAAGSQGPASHYSWTRAMFAKDFNERRYHQKGLSLKLPFRPLLKFAYMMLIRRAFFDGRAGIAYAFLQSFYEYLIVLKTRELAASSSTSTETERSIPQCSCQPDSRKPASLLPVRKTLSANDSRDFPF